MKHLKLLLNQLNFDILKQQLFCLIDRTYNYYKLAKLFAVELIRLHTFD